MIGFVHRRVGIATTAALIVGLMAVTPASAYVAPMEPGSQCQTSSTGYRAVGYGRIDSGAWVWDGQLTWDLCVNRTGSGTHYGVVRLSAPSAQGLKDFWGVVRIYLQACVSGYPTVSQGIWQAPALVRGTLSNGRYWWNWQVTPTTSSYMTGSFRVQVAAYGAVQAPGWYESFFAASTGAPLMGYNTSGCMAP